MLDKIESEAESDIENRIEDSDTEYIAEEPIPDNKEKSHQLLTSEVTVLDIDEPRAKTLEGTVMQIEKALVNDRSCVLKVT